MICSSRSFFDIAMAQQPSRDHYVLNFLNCLNLVVELSRRIKNAIRPYLSGFESSRARHRQVVGHVVLGSIRRMAGILSKTESVEMIVWSSTWLAAVAA